MAEAKTALPPKHKVQRTFEEFMKIVFFICAAAAVISVILISVYLLMRGLPAIQKIGWLNFLGGTDWDRQAEIFGILPMIVGSLYATAGAILIGVPVGVLAAVYLAEFAPKPLENVLRYAVDLLAGIPSVVYGFFGLVVIVPMIKSAFGGAGNSLLAAIIVLSVMILPTIIGISATNIKAVPKAYKEGALAMGSSHVESIFKVTLPAAKSGIFTAVVLGIGRAVGETMAVILVAGNINMIPKSLTDGILTMTAKIAMEMGYSSSGSLHQNALFGIGVVLFVFIMLLNLILSLITAKAGERK